MCRDNNSVQRQSIIELPYTAAKEFFLKAESYCRIDLPPYFSFDKVLTPVAEWIGQKSLRGFTNGVRDYENVNFTLLSNKDGKYSWRPLELIHPVLYVSLVNKITDEDAWELIVERFHSFSENKKIQCLSIPVRSETKQKDKAEQVAEWWHEVEQRSIELALEYEYILETDITDCYGSIYTHSIAWALHSKEKAKAERRDKKHIGNVIDSHIQDMRQGQTNGLPQGSVLMDFLAEMVLGYADVQLSERIETENITDYLILRYRDDYRIFTNNPREGEQIAKLLTEVMIDLGLKLNPTKTLANSDVIEASIKQDKIAWLTKKQSSKNLQKHLLIIHSHSKNYPNSGSLARALASFYDRVAGLKKNIEEPMPLISIVSDIAFRNPRAYSVCAAILSQLIAHLPEKQRESAFEKIVTKFSKIPNTGHIEIWLQRTSIAEFDNIKYPNPLCQLVSGNKASIWESNWITSKELKQIIEESTVVNKPILDDIKPVIEAKEFELFINSYNHNH